MAEAVRMTSLPRESLRQLLLNKKLVGRQRPGGRREWEISEESLVAYLTAQANLAMASGVVRPLRPESAEDTAAGLAGLMRALETALDDLRAERRAHDATRRELDQLRAEVARHSRDLLDSLLPPPPGE
jgi:hypothetical protein